MISYSDGEGSYAQVGIALWAQGQKMARAGTVRIPDDLHTHNGTANGKAIGTTTYMRSKRSGPCWS